MQTKDLECKVKAFMLANITDNLDDRGEANMTAMVEDALHSLNLYDRDGVDGPDGLIWDWAYEVATSAGLLEE